MDITILAYVKDLPSNRISSFGLVAAISITIYVLLCAYYSDISQTTAAPLQTVANLNEMMFIQLQLMSLH